MSTADVESTVTVVVPTIGRPSLHTLLAVLASAAGPQPAAVVVVDDRAGGDPLVLPEAVGGAPLRLLRSHGRGPAGARNVGWRSARTGWVAFLDDDVVPDDDWYARLRADLGASGPEVAGSQGRVRVPLPADRRPTDWERGTAELATAHWITADMAYRRASLLAVGGFDERFPRAFREDADLALRVQGLRGSAAPWRLVHGGRSITHPVRPADRWVSVRVQAGNADDPLMRAVHGRGWRAQAAAPRGRRPRHLALTAAGLGAVVLAASGRRRASAVAAAAWLAGTAELAAARITPGPRTRDEVTTMLLTSAVLPAVATWHYARGLVRHRGAEPWRGLPDVVLLDRDGTLVVDVPYNGDPDRVVPVPGARAACDRLRAAGVRLGVVTNQSGIARGLISTVAADAVNVRVEELLGPFDTWQVCPHGMDDGCSCRKPAPGMVKAACAELGVEPARCVVVGDIGSDVEAAEAAGAGAILVPTPATRREEVAAARLVAADLAAAVDRLLGGTW